MDEIVHHLQAAPGHVEEMVCTLMASALAVWANETGLVGKFADWLRNNPQLMQLQCFDPAHTVPHDIFTKPMDAQLADTCLHYFVKFVVPAMAFHTPAEDVVPGPSPYL